MPLPAQYGAAKVRTSASGMRSRTMRFRSTVFLPSFLRFPAHPRGLGGPSNIAVLACPEVGRVRRCDRGDTTKKPADFGSAGFWSGGPSRTRTGDPLIKSQML